MYFDFNVNLLKSDSDEAVSLYYNTLTSHHYSPFVLQPSRLRSKTLIDNIVFNSLEYHSQSGNLLIEISDHLMQFLVLEGFVKEKKLPKIDLFKRDFKNFNEREFNDEVINKVDWNNVCKLNQKNPHSFFILFKCKHRDTFLKSIAKETYEIVLTNLHSEHKKLRNEITSDKRKSKKEYINSYFEKNKQKSWYKV